jgi:hypothetical protein
VITLKRFVTSLAGVVSLWGSLAVAQSADTGELKSAPAPDLDTLMASFPKWSFSASARAAYGYKDNLLLSFANEERSAFARGQVDFLLLRAPRGPFDFWAYAEAGGTHYFSAQTSDSDSKIRIQAEPGYRFREKWRISLPTTGYYFDQVFDSSTTDFEREVAQLKVKGVIVNPTLRWDVHPAWWLEVQAAAHEKRTEGGVNNSTAGEGMAGIGWKASRRVELRLTGARRWRDFDHRMQYSAAGRGLTDTRLKISEQEFEGRVDIKWDEAKEWQTITRASQLNYGDNGPGYFNFRERQVTQELKWQHASWLCRLEGSAGRIDYTVQKVGIGLAPPKRIKDEFEASIEAERTLSERWTMFARYSWERTRSNDFVFSYRVNEGLLGVRWNWEK